MLSILCFALIIAVFSALVASLSLLANLRFPKFANKMAPYRRTPMARRNPHPLGTNYKSKEVGVDWATKTKKKGEQIAMLEQKMLKQEAEALSMRRISMLILHLQPSSPSVIDCEPRSRECCQRPQGENPGLANLLQKSSLEFGEATKLATIDPFVAANCQRIDALNRR